jgi:hypothetical protein
MTVRHLAIAFLLSLVLVAVATAALWTWTGSGGDDHWDTCANWDRCSIAQEFPGDGDDALIEGTYDVDLIDETIDDLTVDGTVTFGDANGDDPTLEVDAFIVEAGSVVNIGEGAVIQGYPT